MLTQERGIYTKLEVICRGRVHPTQFLPLRPYNTHSFPRFYPPLHRTGLVPALCTCKLARNDQTTALSACTRILNEFIEYISCFLSYLALWNSAEIRKKEILLYKRTAIYLIGHCFIFSVNACRILCHEIYIFVWKFIIGLIIWILTCIYFDKIRNFLDMCIL